MIEWESIEKQVEAIAKEAGKRILAMKKPKVFTKEGHANFVTAADIASQEYIVEHLKPLIPEAGFLAEEGIQKDLPEGFCWIIDPIDGTTNFMRGCRHSAISIGLTKDGEGILGVVYDPDLDEIFHAVQGKGAFCGESRIQVADTPAEQSIIAVGSSPYYRELAAETFGVMQEIFLRCGDIRRSGSAALDLCYVAAGRYDGFYEARLSPWDFAAASVIIQEAGGVITAGSLPIVYANSSAICAGSASIHAILQEVVGQKK
ncbi:MAG: inositol monophosphatase family protein [Candidatus Merdivicinus sp.]|jgi:myo-inositol-1(or 4)-monophosphatase